MASTATIESLSKQNAELQAKINNLKKKLGMSTGEPTEAADDRAKITTIFREFDVNGDGVIDKNEFELLAFRCGAGVEHLVPAKLDAAFAALNTAGNGKITFDEFYNWLKADKGAATVSSIQLGLLRAKLQSKVWFKNFSDVKSGSAPPAAASSSSSSRLETKSDAKAAAPSTPAGDAKVPVTKFQISVGEFKDAGAGFYINGGENTTLANQIREAVSCPEDVPFFIYIDFALRDGFDEGEVGELVGQLDGLIGSIPFNQLPIQVYHSHSINLVPEEKVLRVTFFSQLDPEQTARMLIAGGGGLAALTASPEAMSTPTAPTSGRLIDVLTGEFKLEIPFSLSDLQREDFKLTPDQIKVNLAGSSFIDKNLEARAKELLDKLPALAKYNMQTRLATVKFMKGIDFTFKFSDFASLLEQVPLFDEDDNPNGLRPASVQKLKAALAQAAEMPVATIIQSAIASSPLNAMLGGLPPPLQQTYLQIRRNILGLRRIHVQLHATVTRFDLKGLDVIPFLPAELASAE